MTETSKTFSEGWTKPVFLQYTPQPRRRVVYEPNHALSPRATVFTSAFPRGTKTAA